MEHDDSSLAASSLQKFGHAELSKAPGLELFGSYITCGKNPQLRSTFNVITLVE